MNNISSNTKCPSCGGTLRDNGDGFSVCDNCKKAFRHLEKSDDFSAADTTGNTAHVNAANLAAATANAGAIKEPVYDKRYVKGRYWQLRLMGSVWQMMTNALMCVLCIVLLSQSRGVDVYFGLTVNTIAVIGVAASVFEVCLAYYSKDNSVHRGMIVGVQIVSCLVSLFAMILACLTLSLDIMQLVLGICVFVIWDFSITFNIAGNCDINVGNDIFRKKNAKPRSLPGEDLFPHEKKRTNISFIISAVIAIAIIIVVPLVIIPRSENTLANVNSVMLGMSKYEVEKVMDYACADEDEDVITWYDADYTKLLKKYEDLLKSLLYADDAEAALDIMYQLTDLEEEISAMPHTKFVVTFVDGIAVNISLVNEFGDGSQPEKKIDVDGSEYKISMSRFYEEGDGFYIELTTRYSDGSWTKNYISANIVNMTYNAYDDSYTVGCLIVLGEEEETYLITATADEWRGIYGFRQIEDYYEDAFA